MPKALRLHEYGPVGCARIGMVPRPIPSKGQILVDVGAAGINGLDWKVREGFMRTAMPLTLPITLGVECAGTVAEARDGSRFAAGDRVMGTVSGFGAYAETIAIDEALLNATPASLDDVRAAALPVSTLTAWQAVSAAGRLGASSRVLIHGASGAIGGFAVQFARRCGAEVVAVTSGTRLSYVRSLGADMVVDRQSTRFEDEVSGVDLVIDLVGGDVAERSWSVLRQGGSIVSTVTPGIAAQAPPGMSGQFINTRPDRESLSSFAEKVADGRLVSTIAEVVPFAQLAEALERNRTGHAVGKMVVDIRGQ